MAVNKSLFTSNSDEWRTPDNIFNYLQHHFDFTLDAAATDDNAKCANYFTKQNSAIDNTWSGRIWCNPPYSRGMASSFIEKAHYEIIQSKNAELAWFLLPARTDTVMWHKYVFAAAAEIIFIRGRLRFLDETGQLKSSAPFPSALVMFSSEAKPQRVGTIPSDISNISIKPTYVK